MKKLQPWMTARLNKAMVIILLYKYSLVSCSAMKFSTETASTNLSGLNWNWSQPAGFRAENEVVSPYVRSLIIVRPIRRREPCFFTLKFHRSRRLLAVTLNWTIIFITLISGISLSTYIKTVYWSWVTIRFSVFTKIYSWFTNHSPQNKKFTDLSRKSRKLSWPEKPFQKLRSAYSRKLAFYYDFKIQKGKLVAEFHSWKRLRLWDT